MTIRIESSSTASTDRAFAKAVAAHVIVSLAGSQRRGRAMHLDDLATDIGVRRADVREIVTRLHAEGHVDARRMRLTMTGLVLASSLARCKLRDIERGDEAASILRVA